MIEHGEQWDSYPCRVEDAAAWILLNLWFEDHAPFGGTDTLHFVTITMIDPDEHGVGSPAESATMGPIEDDLAERALTVGLVYVGRLRNHGTWQLTFYGMPSHASSLHALVASTDLGGRAVEVGAKPDPDWNYYRTFLLPDRERRQWMQNRAVVAAIESHGDPMVAPRRVDHWCYFETAAQRDAFGEAVRREGFVLEPTNDGGDGPRPFAAQLYRIDAVALEEIHQTVMMIVELADQHGGDYDGWETSIEASQIS